MSLKYTLPKHLHDELEALLAKASSEEELSQQEIERISYLQGVADGSIALEEPEALTTDNADTAEADDCDCVNCFVEKHADRLKSLEPAAELEARVGLVFQYLSAQTLENHYDFAKSFEKLFERMTPENVQAYKDALSTLNSLSEHYANTAYDEIGANDMLEKVVDTLPKFDEEAQKQINSSNIERLKKALENPAILSAWYQSQMESLRSSALTFVSSQNLVWNLAHTLISHQRNFYLTLHAMAAADLQLCVSSFEDTLDALTDDQQKMTMTFSQACETSKFRERIEVKTPWYIKMKHRQAEGLDIEDLLEMLANVAGNAKVGKVSLEDLLQGLPPEAVAQLMANIQIAVDAEESDDSNTPTTH